MYHQVSGNFFGPTQIPGKTNFQITGDSDASIMATVIAGYHQQLLITHRLVITLRTGNSSLL